MNNDRLKNSYANLSQINANDVPMLVEECLEAGTNLLVYGEPGCGKSSIIESLANEGYEVITLSAATMCEEALFGIPVYDQETKTTPYAMPDWLIRVLRAAKAGKRVILFIDEINLANPIILNGLQIMLTDRVLTTQPDYKLPDDLVFVCAANSQADTTEGTELSRPLKTRFVTVRMMATPESFESYAISVLDEKLPNIKAVLGEEMARQFISDAVTDFAEFWCDNTEYYGTNPRTIMNYFKMCDCCAKRTGELSRNDAKLRAERTTGHATHTFNWAVGQTTTRVRKTKSSLIPAIADIKAMKRSELMSLRETIMNSTKATTKQGIRALMAISEAMKEADNE